MRVKVSNEVIDSSIERSLESSSSVIQMSTIFIEHDLQIIFMTVLVTISIDI